MLIFELHLKLCPLDTRKIDPSIRKKPFTSLNSLSHQSLSSSSIIEESRLIQVYIKEFKLQLKFRYIISKVSEFVESFKLGWIQLISPPWVKAMLSELYVTYGNFYKSATIITFTLIARFEHTIFYEKIIHPD